MATLKDLEAKELVSLQQDLMKERAKAEIEINTKLETVQHELDKRAARERFGTLSDVELEALAEINVERSSSTPDDQE